MRMSVEIKIGVRVCVCLHEYHFSWRAWYLSGLHVYGSVLNVACSQCSLLVHFPMRHFVAGSVSVFLLLLVPPLHVVVTIFTAVVDLILPLFHQVGCSYVEHNLATFTVIL